MSRKPIHVWVDLGWWQRLRFLFAGRRINILLQPTTLGSIQVVDVVFGRRSHRQEIRDAQPD